MALVEYSPWKNITEREFSFFRDINRGRITDVVSTLIELLSFHPSIAPFFFHSRFLLFTLPSPSVFPNRFTGYRWREGRKKGEKKGSDKFDQTARFIAFQLPFNLLREIGARIYTFWLFLESGIRKLCISKKCFCLTCSKRRKGREICFEKSILSNKLPQNASINSLTVSWFE